MVRSKGGLGIALLVASAAGCVPLSDYRALEKQFDEQEKFVVAHKDQVRERAREMAQRRHPRQMRQLIALLGDLGLGLPPRGDAAAGDDGAAFGAGQRLDRQRVGVERRLVPPVVLDLESLALSSEHRLQPFQHVRRRSVPHPNRGLADGHIGVADLGGMQRRRLRDPGRPSP